MAWGSACYILEFKTLHLWDPGGFPLVTCSFNRRRLPLPGLAEVPAIQDMPGCVHVVGVCVAEWKACRWAWCSVVAFSCSRGCAWMQHMATPGFGTCSVCRLLQSHSVIIAVSLRGVVVVLCQWAGGSTLPMGCGVFATRWNSMWKHHLWKTACSTCKESFQSCVMSALQRHLVM